jgi:hypothetical protein
METTRLQEAGSPSPLAARQRRSPSGPAVARPSTARLTGTVRRSVVPDIERSTTHCHGSVSELSRPLVITSTKCEDER